jgi:dolichol kinase
MALAPFLNDTLYLLGSFTFIALIIGISLILKKMDIITGHAARKIVHLFCGFAVFIVPFLNIPFLALLISFPMLILLRIAGPNNFGKLLFNMMAEKDEEKVGYLSGPFSYTLSINILVFIFSFDALIPFFYFPASSIMVMMISDTIASYFGRKYGKHEIRLKYTKTVRTLEGSLALFVSAFLLSMLGFEFFGNWFPENIEFFDFGEVILLAFIVALNSTIIELLSKTNLDDLTVPITGCLLSLGISVILFPTAIGL